MDDILMNIMKGMVLKVPFYRATFYDSGVSHSPIPVPPMIPRVRNIFLLTLMTTLV